MNFITYQKRLSYLLGLIEKESVHSPKQMARQFSCNEKTVRGMINKLREQGYEIAYSRKVKKYLLKK
ncbi:MAG: HTH domain-containing protein [Bacteroidales bacterium]|nr:HTH domain-containing protein [Bacteroidales bacterium]